MKKSKLCYFALLSLAMLMALAPASYAQSIPVVAVGSSGFFGASGIAAISGDSIRGAGPLCGTRFWTGTLSGIDARTTLTTPVIPAESASAWIAWDNDTTPTIVCTYLAVDSIVGQRLFFGTGSTGNGTLSIPTSACTTPGANKIAFVWDTATVGLPVAVWNALQGGNSTASNCTGSTTLNPVHFNVAFTDVRPEDAQFIGNSRVLCNDANSTAFFPPDDKSCMGYGPGVSAPGPAVVSSYSGASANGVAYAFTGTDPISGITVPASQTLSVAEQAVLIFVNTTNTASGGFGDLVTNHGLTNVSSHTLSALYTGQVFATRDVLGANPSAGIPVVFAHALVREPQSGTYTTFEWQVIRQRDGFNANSQETGILGASQPGYSSGCFVQSATAFPTTTCSNPVNFCIGSNCALRTRVIGTGQMISVGNTATLPDTIGYAFWSLGNFGNKLNVRYLTLDGVDPLYPSYSVHNGTFPGNVAGQGTVSNTPAPAAGQCGGYFNGNGGTITTFSCNSYTLPTFDGLQNGSYRNWNYIRASYYGSSAQAPTFSPLNITGYILSAQDQAAPTASPKIPDIVPTAYCANSACSSTINPTNVFRSHYSVGGITPNNGIISGAEAGGDVAGSVFNIQSEKDTALVGGTFLSWIQ
jgi:hypothetical protein